MNPKEPLMADTIFCIYWYLALLHWMEIWNKIQSYLAPSENVICKQKGTETQFRHFNKLWIYEIKRYILCVNKNAETDSNANRACAEASGFKCIIYT